ncbi:MAG TPA: M23 family metallopeptidase [Jatrophihabitantaceae bacterium]|jgi:murein DD-endopeptidase MepM/ murein hydrolase activator NlpD
MNIETWRRPWRRGPRWPIRRGGPLRIRWRRRALVVASLLLLAGSGAPFVAPVSADQLRATPTVVAPTLADARYRAPLPGPIVVLRRFEPPPTPYSAGHRGVDLSAPRGSQVLAASAGRVSFAGRVAGRGVVVIAHGDGIRTEYEPVAPLVSAGQVVTGGQPAGRVHGTHDGQSPDRCLHWGARRGNEYIDPLLLLRPLGPVRLLPWPGVTSRLVA